MDSSEFENGYTLEGYTRITTRSGDGCKLLLCAHRSFQGIEWHDWVYVQMPLKTSIQPGFLDLLQ